VSDGVYAVSQVDNGEDAVVTTPAKLKIFNGKPMEFIKKCAFEIATLGMGGISPDKKEGYKIPSIDKDFGGYEMLAYYYVSWALAIPDKVKMLGLPFDTAYQNALQMFKMMK
jgi:hypothetical protein